MYKKLIKQNLDKVEDLTDENVKKILELLGVGITLEQKEGIDRIQSLSENRDFKESILDMTKAKFFDKNFITDWKLENNKVKEFSYAGVSFKIVSIDDIVNNICNTLKKDMDNMDFSDYYNGQDDMPIVMYSKTWLKAEFKFDKKELKSTVVRNISHYLSDEEDYSFFEHEKTGYLLVEEDNTIYDGTQQY